MKKKGLARLGPALALVVFLVLLSSAPVMALDGRAGDAVAVGSDEDIQEDLYLAGRTITTSADVDGDVFVAGQTVTIGGDISGGVTVGAQTLSINGDVEGGVRAGGQTVDVAGNIARDLVVGCATLILNSDASIGDDLYVGAGDAALRGDIGGDIYGGAESMVIAGTVGGDVHVEVGSLDIEPGAIIEGNLWYSAPAEVTIPKGSVKGDVTFTERVTDEDRQAAQGAGALAPFMFFASFTWRLIAYLMALVTGIIMILLLPRAMSAAPMAIRSQTGPVAGWGAIVLFLTPLAAIILCITVVGLPVGLIAFVLWGVLLYIAQIPVAIFIGYLILGRSRTLEGKGFMIGCLALGLLLISLVKLIPFVGFFVSLAVAVFGIGALLIVDRKMLSALRNSDWENEP